MAVSAGFQLHSCTSLDVIDLFCQVERCATHVAKTLPSKQPGCDSSGWRQALAPGDAACSIAGQVSSRTLRSSPPYDLLLQPWACSGVHIYSSVSSQLKKSSAPLQSPLVLAAPQPGGSALLERHGVQLALFRARRTKQGCNTPAWEVCALGGGAALLMNAVFYKSDQLALLLKGPSGTTLTLKNHSSVAFVPMDTTDSAIGIGVAGAVPSLNQRLLRMLQHGSLALCPLENGGGRDERGTCAPRGRSFPRVEAVQLALSHARGMAALATDRRVVLLDLEDDGDGEDDEDARGQRGNSEGLGVIAGNENPGDVAMG